mmetsp:Transcript_118467/g.330476  ORF Transcript_118467/g.330476 Transcript_118467/m.330476 type:complete len:349 (-) Transcript_118467:151-1197(-)
MFPHATATERGVSPSTSSASSANAAPPASCSRIRASSREASLGVKYAPSRSPLEYAAKCAAVQLSLCRTAVKSARRATKDSRNCKSSPERTPKHASGRGAKERSRSCCSSSVCCQCHVCPHTQSISAQPSVRCVGIPQLGQHCTPWAPSANFCCRASQVTLGCHPATLHLKHIFAPQQGVRIFGNRRRPASCRQTRRSSSSTSAAAASRVRFTRAGGPPSGPTRPPAPRRSCESTASADASPAKKRAHSSRRPSMPSVPMPRSCSSTDASKLCGCSRDLTWSQAGHRIARSAEALAWYRARTSGATADDQMAVGMRRRQLVAGHGTGGAKWSASATLPVTYRLMQSEQ